MNSEEMLKKIVKELDNEWDNSLDLFVALYNKNKKLKNIVNNINYEKIDYSKIKCFKFFDNIKDFYNYSNNLYSCCTWSIFNSDYNTRALSLSSSSFYNDFKNDFNSLKLCNSNISDEQAISILDTMSLMYIFFKKLQEKNKDIFDEIKLVMELLIPNNEKNRIDYVILFRNSIILLEFGLCNSFNNLKDVSEKKKNQINDYKNELEKYLSNKIIISTESIVYSSDYSRNEKILNDLCVRVLNTFNKSSVNSFKELLKIEYN